jgi:hypothetical protein
MNITSNMNTYQNLNIYQREQTDFVTTPVEPKEPTYTNKEIYEASDGNLIRNKEDELVLTPQGKINLDNTLDEKQQEQIQKEQDQKDVLRAAGTDYLAMQSKKSQVEIYLAVATDGEVSLDDDKTPSIIESLRDVQKQNNAVEAYATYAQN